MPDPVVILLGEVAELRRDVGEMRQSVAGAVGTVNEVKASVDRLHGAVGSLGTEMRSGQAAQDTRINEISTAQARHGALIGLGSAFVGILSGFFGRGFSGH